MLIALHKSWDYDNWGRHDKDYTYREASIDPAANKTDFGNAMAYILAILAVPARPATPHKGCVALASRTSPCVANVALRRERRLASRTCVANVRRERRLVSQPVTGSANLL